jgi:anti-sigma B factor antagonist
MSEATGSAQEVPMGLEVNVRKAGDVTILDLHGRATIGVGNDVLNARLRQTLDTGTRKLLLNVAGLLQIDSSGISTIVRTFVSMGRNGGSLKLVGPQGRVREVLEVTHLLGAIPTYDSEASALQSFK